MGMRRLPALLMGMTSVSHGQSAALRPNGTVIRHAPCEFGSYAEQSAFTRRYYTNQEFELPRAGFIVVATQYRGNDGGTGREELGGADVSDVVNLFRVAANLPSSDTANTFLYGVSRGGMMTMLTLKRGVTPNAAAVVGAVFDLDTTLKYTQTIAPQIAREVKSLIPSYDRDSVRALSDRSAIR